jgi:hypothetical protein
METAQADTAPQRAEGITACRWVAYGEATESISYGNARQVLRRAYEIISGTAEPGPPVPLAPPDEQLDLGVDERATAPEGK